MSAANTPLYIRARVRRSGCPCGTEIRLASLASDDPAENQPATHTGYKEENNCKRQVARGHVYEQRR